MFLSVSFFVCYLELPTALARGAAKDRKATAAAAAGEGRAELAHQQQQRQMIN